MRQGDDYLQVTRQKAGSFTAESDHSQMLPTCRIACLGAPIWRARVCMSEWAHATGRQLLLCPGWRLDGLAGGKALEGLVGGWASGRFGKGKVM